MKTLELFSGTQSFSKVARELGHETFCVELDEYFEADLHRDILNVKREDLPKKIDILWASPPCTSFSVASIGSSWCGNYCPKRVETALGMAYVLKTLQLIKEIKKDNPNLIWFIENPRGVLRKMAFMDELHRETVWYCKYGDTRAKPTDIWNNLEVWEGKCCKNGNKDCHHEPAPRGSKTGTQGLGGAKDRSRIPPALFKEIFILLRYMEVYMRRFKCSPNLKSKSVHNANNKGDNNGN